MVGSDEGDDRAGDGADRGGGRGDPTGDRADPAGGRSATPTGHECPFCGSTDTERESAFGTEVSAEQHYCHGCHTVFERIKFDGATAPTGRHTE